MRDPIRRDLGPAVRALALLMSLPAAGAAAQPDLTRGETKGVDRRGTYNLGPTGLRGWIYSKPVTHFDGLQGRTTALSRQILVTHVGAKSPADGILAVDDVILGAAGKRFTDDARKSLAAAIQEAEKESSGGILRLTRWRAGRIEEVQLKLRVLGTYSETAPYDCPKSKRILEEACRVLENEPLEPNWHGAISGLALMATGNPAYLPKVQALARKIARSVPSGQRYGVATSMWTWEWGYQGIFLSEYFLLTRDKEVEPAVHRLTRLLARGQSLYGTFGHGFAERTPEGSPPGSIPPYGPVNMAGLPANLAIVLGQKCGVKDPEVEAAIGRAVGFFGYYVDKGAIPYGEHEPWPYHENNGKNSLCAVMFSLLPGQARAAQFFAKMATAGYRNRECGHTGQGFSYLWSALGAHAGGPAAAAAFFKESSWHLDLVRRCDGSFTYDGDEQYGPGRTEDDTYYGKSSYYGLSPNATYVLTYAMPLRKLAITGRDAKEANGLSKKEVADAIASGRFDLDRLQKSPQELVAAFRDWSPIVRGWAAEELARRPEAKAMVPQLIAMAEGNDPHVIQGACETLGNLRSGEALPVLVRRLAHEDRWVRFKAAQAIRKMGAAAKPVLPDLLRALVQTAEPLQPINWADPIQLAHGQLAAAVFGGPLKDALRQADPQLLYAAIRSVARNPDGMARATLRDFFENRLTAEDVQALGPEILDAVKTRCPADTMFGNEIRMGALKALTRHHFKEGMDAAVHFAKTQGGHGSENRTGEIMKALVTYGSAARDTIPALQELIADFHAQVRAGEFPGGALNNRRVRAVEEAIKAIEAAKDHPELRSLRPGQGPGK